MAGIATMCKHWMQLAVSTRNLDTDNVSYWRMSSKTTKPPLYQQQTGIRRSTTATSASQPLTSAVFPLLVSHGEIGGYHVNRSCIILEVSRLVIKTSWHCKSNKRTSVFLSSLWPCSCSIQQNHWPRKTLLVTDFEAQLFSQDLHITSITIHVDLCDGGYSSHFALQWHPAVDSCADSQSTIELDVNTQALQKAKYCGVDYII